MVTSKQAGGRRHPYRTVIEGLRCALWPIVIFSIIGMVLPLTHRSPSPPTGDYTSSFHYATAWICLTVALAGLTASYQNPDS